MPAGDDEREAIAGRYREYGALVHPRSPLYAELALGVAHDRAALDLLATLPPGKRQPLLVFGAARALFGDPDGWPQLRAVLRDHGEEVTALARRRATQLNEPLRCATLLPLLARLPGPLALLEVGASAGLCLLPDRYAYEYDGGPRVNAGAPGPVLRCAVRGPVPLPQRVPEVVWRAGLDLAPVDLGDDEAVRWLEAFVPPDDPERLARLRAAAAVARADPPRVVAGDLRTDLPALAASAPDEGRSSSSTPASSPTSTTANERRSRRPWGRSAPRGSATSRGGPSPGPCPRPAVATRWRCAWTGGWWRRRGCSATGWTGASRRGRPPRRGPGRGSSPPPARRPTARPGPRP